MENRAFTDSITKSNTTKNNMNIDCQPSSDKNLKFKTNEDSSQDAYNSHHHHYDVCNNKHCQSTLKHLLRTIERHKHHGVWEPVQTFVTSLQSKIKSHNIRSRLNSIQHPTNNYSQNQQLRSQSIPSEVINSSSSSSSSSSALTIINPQIQKLQQQPCQQYIDQHNKIDHLGRFDVGHPLGCNSSIADVLPDDEECDFYPDILQPTITLPHRKTSLTENIDHKLRKEFSVYMENDNLSRTYIGSQKNPLLIRINVSGTVFHVKHSTLQRDPFVFGKMLEDGLWIDQTHEYYFERDPEVFRFILSYLRRGELHLPHDMCGPLVEKELDDWGIALGLDIQRCCLGPVMESKSKLESLHKFEENLRPEVVKPDYWIKSYKWQSFREILWSILDTAPRLHSSSSNKTLKHYNNVEFFQSEFNSEIEPADQLNENESNRNCDLNAKKILTNSNQINPVVNTKCLNQNQNTNNNVNMNNPIDSNEQMINNNNNVNNMNINQCPNKLESNLIENTQLNNLNTTTMNTTTIMIDKNYDPNSIKKFPPSICKSNLTSRKESPYLLWLRRFYLIYETLIVTSALIVFMLSTVSEFREPIEINTIANWSNNNVTINSYIDQSFLPTHLTDIQTNPINNNNNVSGNYNNSINGKNNNKLSLPIKLLIQMDIFFSIAITIDVLMRMIFCPNLIVWFCSVYTIIDILSLIPFYCEFIFYELVYNNTFENSTWWIISVLRVEEYIIVLKVFVVLRLFRVLRRHRGTRVLLYTIRTTIADVSVIIILILESALFFGSAIYFVDSNFPNIPRGFWWALITMSTVGYGDLVPKNTFGYIVAITCIIIGTLLMSYTIPVLVNHFLLYYAHADQLYMVKQLHRTAKRKIRTRKMSRYLQKALSSAKNFMTITINNKSHENNEQGDK